VGVLCLVAQVGVGAWPKRLKTEVGAQFRHAVGNGVRAIGKWWMVHMRWWVCHVWLCKWSGGLGQKSRKLSQNGLALVDMDCGDSVGFFGSHRPPTVTNEWGLE